MREIDVLSRVPLPDQRRAPIPCDRVLFEELRVAAQLGRVEGLFLPNLTATVRLTPAGLTHLQQLQRRERGDA